MTQSVEKLSDLPGDSEVLRELQWGSELLIPASTSFATRCDAAHLPRGASFQAALNGHGWAPSIRFAYLVWFHFLFSTFYFQK